MQVLIKELLLETEELCEYAVYVLGKLSCLWSEGVRELSVFPPLFQG